MIHQPYWGLIYRFKTKNIGDRVCCPALYFDLPKTIKIDILESNTANNINYIIGGGGILNFNDRVLKLIKKCNGSNKKVILWGCGHNNHHDWRIKYPEWINKADLIGIRDWGTNYTWVPCVSCMSPLFDIKYPITQDVIYYRHYGINHPNVLGNQQNDAESLDTVLKHLGSGQNVVTNSYHGAYWATLLNRNVFVYPNSSKFFGLKHPPVILNNNEHWYDKKNKSMSYDCLDECRQANINFYEHFKKL